MTKHVPRLIVVLVLAVSAGACGDDSGAKSGSGASGTSGGNAGSGAGSKPTAAEAAAGMCGMMSTGMDSCTGIEEFTQCSFDMCGLQDCVDGECKEFYGCIQSAADPCAPMGCTATDACTKCQLDAGLCSAGKCMGLLKCSTGAAGGMTKAGGACDQLDACCKTQAEGVKDICAASAGGARSAGGDSICEMVKAALCTQ